jgi:hypothetical protein
VIKLYGFDKNTEHRHIISALRNNSFKDGICHLCTGEPSSLFYCHKMYGSPIRVEYGAYIKKLSLEHRITERQAENIVREMRGVPKIGEGWIQETILFYKIKSAFPNINVVHQGRPTWLKNQRFDVWIPSRKIAIEYNGKQHYEPVDFFGGIEGFEKLQELDDRKATLCAENGVRLFIVRYDEDMDAAVSVIRSECENK